MRRVVDRIPYWDHFPYVSINFESDSENGADSLLPWRGTHCIGGCLEAYKAAMANIESRTWRNSKAIKGACRRQNSHVIEKVWHA